MSHLKLSASSGAYVFFEKGFLSPSQDKRFLYAICQDNLVVQLPLDPSGRTNAEELTTFNGPVAVGNYVCCASAADNLSIAAGYTNGHVQLLRLDPESCTFQAVLVARCVGQVQAVAISPDGSILAFAGMENDMKIVGLSLPNFPILASLPFGHAIKHIAFDATGKAVAAVDVSGMLRVFHFPEESAAPVLAKALSAAKCGKTGTFRLSWSPKQLAVLFDGSLLHVYNRKDWSIAEELRHACMNGAETMHFVSETVLLFAAGTDTTLYSLGKRSAVASMVLTDIPGCLVATSDSFAYYHSLKDGCVYEVAVHIDSGDLVAEEAVSEEEESTNLDDEHMSDIASSSEDESEHGDGAKANEVHSQSSVLPRHPIVQPGCTPWRNLQRFLAYNQTGFITARRELDSKLFHYDIEFTDRNLHKPIRFSDETEYTLASVNEHGAVLSSSPSSFSPALLHYIEFGGTRISWTIQLPSASSPLRKTYG